MLQRSREDDSEDSQPIYVEIEDQINAAVGIIKSCKITADRFELELTEPLLGSMTIVAALNLNSSELTTFSNMTKRIFIGFEDLLTVDLT